ncbi:MAG TPA: SUMF1/EgtB/PvdO family nonheme iron enzyme [Kiritimatiellia bacterium]|nr:SUMF1/EgtB/PvdO family nonheme iron enzyme [Kiritimatiellia bacterium]HMO99934.1 SUMF1/EgtB/PvdO family nonheme iron enzyme [Kiritimatiellia bacterium]
MIKRALFAIIVASLMSPAFTSAQTVIDGLEGHGILSWNEPVMIGDPPIFGIEWAPQADGPWYRTLDNLATVDANGRTNWSVDIPRFFRVVRTTAQPPLNMAWVEGGDFVMGDTTGINPNATPVHTNHIDSFWIDATEVTLAHWQEVYQWATNNSYTFSNAGAAKAASHPVTEINWFDAIKWCNARSEKEGLFPVYLVGFGTYQQGEFTNVVINGFANGYRLPTEAEWEKAARGGRQNKMFPWGFNTISHAQANYFSDGNNGTNVFYPYDISPTLGDHPATSGPDPRTLPVRSFDPNGYGIFDMSGNVSEWCWDWHANVYSAGNKTNPVGPATGSQKVVRGGSWRTGPIDQANVKRQMVSARGSIGPAEENDTIGFRCVRKP